MSDEKQLNLIPESDLPDVGRLSAETSLQAAMGEFSQHMQDEGFSIHTRKAFSSDLRLLGKFLGIGQQIGDIGTKDLNDFLYWLAYDRGVPCSPKSYARRVTSIKVFFGWLHKTDVLIFDPSNAVVQRTVTSPLPVLPTEDEIVKALGVTHDWRVNGYKGKFDARPYLLLTLLLKTGMKKSEAMTLIPDHVDRNAEEPYVFVRYKNPRLRYKERKLALDPEWLDVLDEYLEQYAPPDTLFTCTARNLEYILHDVGEVSGLNKSLFSFENLRWYSTLRDYTSGVEQDEIRQRLGLSKITWRQMRKKLDKLVQQQKERGELGD